jgi:hypothetical protein
MNSSFSPAHLEREDSLFVNDFVKLAENALRPHVAWKRQSIPADPHLIHILSTVTSRPTTELSGDPRRVHVNNSPKMHASPVAVALLQRANSAPRPRAIRRRVRC